MTTNHGDCRKCGKDLPVPRNSFKKICDDCRHNNDLARMRAWQRAHSSRDPVKKRCEYQGGAGREEQYRPPTACLGEFEVGPKNAKRAKYCKACAPFAKKALSAENANARYQSNPEKFAKIALTNRHNRRKAAGRPCRRIGSMQPCKYRDKRGRRGEGCKRRYKLRSSAQKYCDRCRLHADADRAQDYRDEHHDELLPKYRAKGKRLRMLAALSKKPVPWRLIVPLLLLNPGLSNAEVQERAGTDEHTRTMTRIRDFCGIAGPQGRPSGSQTHKTRK